MFKIGDQVIYSVHGICEIEDICEKTVLGITKWCYVLRPVDSTSRLTISTPINNEKVVMLELLDQKEALEILEVFKGQGAQWVTHTKQCHEGFFEIVRTGDRKEIAKVLTVLIRKNLEFKDNNQQFHEQDYQLLNKVRQLLFRELAHALNSSFEEINESIMKSIKGN